MAAMDVPLATTEPNLNLPAALLAAVAERYRAAPRPWTVLALGGSHPTKDWPTAHWKTFIDALRRRTAGSVFLIGGRQHAERAAELVAGQGGAMAINACDLAITEAAGLLRLADLFVGPDSGPMNLAAAGGPRLSRCSARLRCCAIPASSIRSNPRADRRRME